MGKLKVIYRDQDGNTLSYRYIKSRNTHQYSVRDKRGHLLGAEDLDRIKRRARAAGVYLIEARGPPVRKWKDKAGTNYIIQRGTLPKK